MIASHFPPPCDALRQNPAWRHIAIDRIDQLGDAVMGAGLDAVQMNNGPFRGSLVFHEQDDLLLSCGRIDGTVALRGALSENKITVGVVLNAGPGSWHWMHEIYTGSVGVFRPGDLHDSFYGPGSSYVAATLDLDRLEAIAAEQGAVLDNRGLGGSRVHERLMDMAPLRALTAGFDHVHAKGAPLQADNLVDLLMANLALHFARPPRQVSGKYPFERYTRIVVRARDHIHDNLNAPIRINDLVAAAMTSRRTLFRAFMEVMGEPPQTYVRRLRLHRIRQDLASDREALCTIALIGSHWGIEEPSRLACWYREIFGELPSQTMAKRSRAQ